MESGSDGSVTYYGEANYYELLEVAQEASHYEIEEAYRQQMDMLSGDSLATYGLFVGEDLVHARSKVEEAYRVLSDPERRRAYDLAEFDHSVVSELDVKKAGVASKAEPPSAAEAAEALLADAMSDSSEGMADTAAPDMEDVEPMTESPPAEAMGERRKTAKGDRTPASPPPSMAFGTLEGESEPEGGPDAAGSEAGMAPKAKEKPTRALPKVPGWKPAGGKAADKVGGEPKPAKPAGKSLPAVDIQAFDGLSLKAAREQQGISRQDISHITRIAEYYIEYIEEERFSKLPPAIYLRAYLRQYAEAIGADPEKTVTGYLERYNASKGG